jgi:hypothetical protein
LTKKKKKKKKEGKKKRRRRKRKDTVINKFKKGEKFENIQLTTLSVHINDIFPNNYQQNEANITNTGQ